MLRLRRIALILALCLIGNVMCAMGTPLARSNDETVEVITRFLDKNGQSPASYIVSKLKMHRLALIGEDHWIHDHPAFLADLIRAIRTDGSVQLDYLALEFGNARDQALADELINSRSYREDRLCPDEQHPSALSRLRRAGR